MTLRRLVSSASRASLALTLFLLVLAILRWGPVYAEPLWDVRALPLALPIVVLAGIAALAGGPGERPRAAPLLWALAIGCVGLVIVIGARGQGGLAARVTDARGGDWLRPAGAVDLASDDLADVTRVRRRTVVWDGPLLAPDSGAYRFWVDADGAVELRIDGRTLLQAAGEAIRAGADTPMSAGAHALSVRLDTAGPSRLRLGWVRPGGRSEAIPPRYLGPPSARALWHVTDLLALVVAALIAALVFALPWDVPRRPTRREVTRRELAVATAGFAVLAALMSWPLVLDLAGSGPLQKPDGRLNAWILAWDVHALLHEPARLFQAPIFHPLPDALAFTENLLVPAVLAAPAILLGNPALGYNLVLLVSCVVSGLGVHLLVRRATGDRLAGFVAGAAFAVGAHRWFRLAHLHAEVTLFLPFVLLALDRFWQRRTLRRALLVGLLFALQGLSSVYLGAITGLVVAVCALAALAGGLRGREAGWLALGLLLAAVLMAPVVRPYLRMRAFEGAEFTLADEANYATTLESYAASSSRVYAPLTVRHMDMTRVRDPLFPGLALLGFGIAGLSSAPRRFALVALLASTAAVVISLGPATPIYRFLYEHVVFFHGIRALSRFSLVPVLALSILTGFSLAGRWRLAWLALGLILLESAHVPLRYAPFTPPSDAARWLAGRDGAVAFLPLGPERDTHVMLDGVAHFRPLVNGDSGFIPRPYDRALELLAGPLTADGLRFLRAVGVRHVVASDERDLPVAARFGSQRVYAVTTGEAAREIALGRPQATSWGGDGALVDLGAEIDVERIAFELSDAPWLEAPRVWIAADLSRWTEVAARASLADATLALYRDPRHANGELRLAGVRARYLRLDPRLPARPGVTWVAP